MKDLFSVLFGIGGAVLGCFIGKLAVGLAKSAGATMVTTGDVLAFYLIPIALLSFFGWEIGRTIFKNRKK